MKLVKLNTARNCLKYLIKLYGIKDLWLPYYICPSLRKAVLSEDCKIHNYHIDSNFFPTKKFNQDDFIVYPNYFGICTKNVEELAKIYKNLIVDNAHAFFAKSLGLASFVSLRKFFPVNDGAYLYCEKILDEEFEHSKDIAKIETEEDYLKNELYLDKEDIKLISKSSDEFMISANLKDLKSKRLEKFNYWDKLLSSTNDLKIEISSNDAPFVYPYLTNNDVFVDNLVGVNVFRYWNSLPKSFEEYKFYRHLIPIPLV